MRIVVLLFAAQLSVAAGVPVQLVLPPQVVEFAKAHHCTPMSDFVTDEESSQAAPFTFQYEFNYGPPKALFAAWCTRDAAASKRTYRLLIQSERSDHPLRTCPDEIPNVVRIGRPEIDAGPMIPHDFVMLDTGERLTVRDKRVMFGVRNHMPAGSDFYACVAGRWAHYAPEGK